MTSVTTQIDSATGGLRIDWIEPHDGYEQIYKYFVEILDSTQTSWIEETTHCAGSDPSLLYCIIPMSVLHEAPYTLQF